MSNLDRVYRWAEGRAEALARNPRWPLLVALLSAVLCLLAAFPDYKSAAEHLPRDESWRSFEAQVEHPLTPRADLAPASHEAKRAFRLLMPVVAHALGVGGVWCLVLQAVLGLAYFLVFLVIAHEVTGDQVAATFLTLGLATIYPGCAFFYDLTCHFDAPGYLLLLLAMWVRRPWLLALVVFLCGFTDERTFVCLGFVWLRWKVEAHGAAACTLGDLLRPDRRVAAILGGALLNLGARALLHQAYGLNLPMSAGGMGLPMIRGHFLYAPVALLPALEAMWLVVLLAGFGVWVHRRLALGAAFGLTLVACALQTLAVLDFTRSMAYAFPAVVLGLQLVRQLDPAQDLRRLAFHVAGLCLLIPTVVGVGNNAPAWLSPVLPKVLRWFAGS